MKYSFLGAGVLGVLLWVGCGAPPVPLTTLPGNGTVSYATSVDGSSSAPSASATTSSAAINGVSSSTSAPAPSPTPSPSSIPKGNTKPVCTIPTPSLKSVTSTQYYLSATVSVDSTTLGAPISYVSYSIADLTGYVLQLGTQVNAPYEIKVPLTGAEAGVFTLSATLFTQDGQFYPMACSTSFQLHW